MATSVVDVEQSQRRLRHPSYNNEVNLAETITDPGGQHTELSYNNDNALRLIEYPNGVSQRNVFETDDEGHETGRVQRTYATRSDEGDLLDLRYDYRNDAGEDMDLRMAVTDKRADEKTSYAYDLMNRLASATTKDAENPGDPLRRYTYEYRSDGARTRATQQDTPNANAATIDYSYDQTELTDIDQGQEHISLAYDDNGDLTSQSDGYAYSYNPLGQTTAIDAPGTSDIPFTYNGSTQVERRSKADSDYTHTQLGLSRETQGLQAKDYLRDPRGRLISQTTAGQRYYYLLDPLGTVAAVTDQDGQVAARYVYDPYGRQLPATTGSAPNPYKFAGEYYDTQTNHYKIGARYYNPRLGRWTQPDPLDQALSPREANPYPYAAGDPVNHTDPSGMLLGLDDRIVGAFLRIQCVVRAALAGAAGAILTSPSGPVGPALFGVGAALIGTVCVEVVNLAYG